MADTRRGFDQILANPKPQQITINVDIAAGSSIVASDANLLPGHAHDVVGAHRPADQPSPVLSSPPRGADTVAGEVGAAGVNRSAGVAMSSD